MASFGVFDGHSGSLASSVCAKELHSQIASTFSQLMEAAFSDERTINLLQMMAPDDRNDSLLCESIRRSCADMNDLIRSSGKDSGTNAISLFLYKNENHSVRAICSNIGDSRCVVFTPTLSSVKFLPLPEREKVFQDELKSFPMNEEHKISLLRERLRILGKVPLSSGSTWKVRPPTVFVSLPAAIIAYENLSYAAACPTFELGYPEKSRVSAADCLLLALKSAPLSLSLKSDRSRTMGSESSIHTSDLSEDDFTISSRGLESSTASLRQSYSVKIRTTRSIGHRSGPKGLLAVPEFSAVTIQPDETARFILGSKAFWSSIDEDIVSSAVRTFPDATQLASYLGKRAETSVVSADITAMHVIVVDVNPSIFLHPDVPVRVGRGCNCVVS